MPLHQSRILTSPTHDWKRTSTFATNELHPATSNGHFAKSLIGSNVLGTNATSWSLGLGIELDQIFSAAVSGSLQDQNEELQCIEELPSQEHEHKHSDTSSPPRPLNERPRAFPFPGTEGNATSVREDKSNGVSAYAGRGSVPPSPSLRSVATIPDSARPMAGFSGRRLSYPVASVLTTGLEPCSTEASPRPLSTSSSATTRSDRMMDHARIFPGRLRTSSGSLRDAYAGRHTPVLRSAGFSDAASPALSTYSGGRWGARSGSVPGSGPSTPRAPVSRGEAGYMGKQTFIAYSKSSPRSALMGSMNAVYNTSTSSSLSCQGSQSDINMHGGEAAAGGGISRKFGSLDTMQSSPWMTPSIQRAASVRTYESVGSRLPRHGSAGSVRGSPMIPMTRDAAVAEEGRLDQELRALRRRSMTNEIYRSHSVGCLPHGAHGGGSRSFEASVPGCNSPPMRRVGRKRVISSPSIGSIRSLMTPIVGGGGQGFFGGADNGSSSCHQSLTPPKSDGASESPAPSSASPPGIGGSLYLKQSYSQAPLRRERKGMLRSVFSTPSLTSFRRSGSSFSLKTALSAIVGPLVTPPSPTPSSISTSSSTASDLIMSVPPEFSADPMSAPLSDSIPLSAEELIQAELSAIELERIERERVVAAAATAAAAAAASTTPVLQAVSPRDTTMEEAQPQDGLLLGPPGMASPMQQSRANSVMSTDTDAVSIASSSTHSATLPFSHQSRPPQSHPAQSPLPQSHPLPRPHPLPRHPTKPSSTPRDGGADDCASISSHWSKRTIQLGNLKKILTKPFAFARDHPLQRGSPFSSTAKSAKGPKSATAAAATAATPTMTPSSPAHPSQQDGKSSVRFPTKDDIRKFQWDYRRHVNPMHDDT
ncbi:hypothetical protein DFQ26_007421 [Actinomortierella ambigua]|nr:hypothetical protein DFQ26_007421 [Actinomortierella ambigua]